MEKPWYFIQLSDTHIVADTRQESHGVNTYATLSRAITQINHLDPPPAFAIFTGDLINDEIIFRICNNGSAVNVH